MAVSESSYGMITRVWGVCFWLVLHCISLNYPVHPSGQDKKRYKAFFESLQWVLPCKACRESYGKFITAKGRRTQLTLATMRNRETVARWMYEVHRAVSQRIDKQTAVSFHGMCQKFEQFRAGQCNTHGCDAGTQKKRKRAVVMVMDDDTYKQMGFKSSLVVL